MNETNITHKEEPRRVACPARLQKRMRRNLVKVSLNRFDKVHAKKASELLAHICNDGYEAAAPPDNEPVVHQRHQTTLKPSVPSVGDTDSDLPREAVGRWKKWFGRLSAFGRRRKR